ncbi:hypothetical protein L484_010882 [Morus notabilis]|uniref:Uncharacterized protein n=1 Tax=Morus notabilis TaxID=981085 RepID=W9QYP1_9ROSA|nr:hypothetical protein L484_010882 [Morus notabilis]
MTPLGRFCSGKVGKNCGAQTARRCRIGGRHGHKGLASHPPPVELKPSMQTEHTSRPTPVTTVSMPTTKLLAANIQCLGSYGSVRLSSRSKDIMGQFSSEDVASMETELV